MWTPLRPLFRRAAALQALVPLLALSFLALSACMAGGTPPLEDGADPCRVQLDQQRDTFTQVGAQLNTSVGQASGQAGHRELVQVKTVFDDLHRDYNLSNAALCSDFDHGRLTQAQYARQRVCLERRAQNLRAMSLLLSSADKWPAQSLAWELSSKLEDLKRGADCGLDDFDAAQAVPIAAGVQVDPSGNADAGAFHFDTQGQAFTPRDLSLQVAVECERHTGGGQYTPEARCVNNTFTHKDRFRFHFRGAPEDQAPFYIYAFLANDQDQFQVLYPNQPDECQDPKRRRLAPFQPYALPPVDAPEPWFTLDDTKDVHERFWIVLSSDPVRELERLCGAGDLSNKPDEARRARALVEPFLTRVYDPASLAKQWTPLRKAPRAAKDGAQDRGSLKTLPPTSRDPFAPEETLVSARAFDALEPFSLSKKGSSKQTPLKTPSIGLRARSVVAVELGFYHR